MNKPTLKQLKYLCAVAQSRHFGQAAQACYVTQSTLSAGIHELEQSLGVILLERNKKTVLLTAIGEEILGRAQQILAELDELMSVAASGTEPLAGRLRLGVIPTIAPFLLPKVLEKLRQDYPDLQLLIREDLSQNIVRMLQQGELDVILLALPYAMQDVVELHLFNDRFVLAYPRQHHLLRQRALQTEHLQGEEVLLLEEGHCLRDHVLSACNLLESQISAPFKATSLHTIVQMVANRIGITLLPQMAIDSGILRGTSIATKRFIQPEVARSIGLAWRKSSSRSHEYELLGKYIKKIFRARNNK